MTTPTFRTWPLFDGPDERGRVTFVTGERSVREAIWNILLTRPGERLMRPQFGAGIEEFLHQPNNETNRSLLASIVERAVRRWEPRIDTLTVEVVTVSERPTEVQVTLGYRMRHDGRAGEVVLQLGFDR